MQEGKPAPLPDADLIEISTETALLTLAIDRDGNLLQQYIGKKGGLDLVFARNEPDQAYPTIQSNNRFVYWGEPALHVIHSDGHTSTQLKYAGHETQQLDANITQTRITLKDPNYPFYTDIFYKAYIKQNVLEQWTVIYHEEPANVIIKEAASAAITLRSPNYWLTQFTGDWASEFNLTEYPLNIGSKVLENKWGISSSNGRQPHFMLSLGGKPSETEGYVLAGTLAWSGNFRLQFEHATSGQLTAMAGINPWSADIHCRQIKNTSRLLLLVVS